MHLLFMFFGFFLLSVGKARLAISISIQVKKYLSYGAHNMQGKGYDIFVYFIFKDRVYDFLWIKNPKSNTMD